MLQLCSYETDALGYSAFCKIFTGGLEVADYYDLCVLLQQRVRIARRRCSGMGYLEWVLPLHPVPVSQLLHGNPRFASDRTAPRPDLT